MMRLHNYIGYATKTFRCFRSDFQPMTQAQYLERQHKSELLPGVKDGYSEYESEYWSSRNFIYYACNGYKNPHLVKQFWEEMDYYEVFEIFVHNTINNINRQ